MIAFSRVTLPAPTGFIIAAEACVRYWRKGGLSHTLGHIESAVGKALR